MKAAETLHGRQRKIFLMTFHNPVRIYYGLGKLSDIIIINGIRCRKTTPLFGDSSLLVNETKKSIVGVYFEVDPTLAAIAKKFQETVSVGVSRLELPFNEKSPDLIFHWAKEPIESKIATLSISWWYMKCTESKIYNFCDVIAFAYDGFEEEASILDLTLSKNFEYPMMKEESLEFGDR